jgi:hypothetical protein
VSSESTFHHFADYNWDLDRGAPPFVSEPPGTQIKADPVRLAVFKDYVRNLATWLQPATGTPDGRSGKPVDRQGSNSFTARSLFVTSRAAVLYASENVG